MTTPVLPPTLPNGPADILSVGAARPARPVRLLALDLDGTCLDRDQRLHERTRSAVRRALEEGIVVVVATGRMYRSALPWARELGVTAPLICYQGAVIRELPTAASPSIGGVPLGAAVSEHPLDAAIALAVLREARAQDWHFQAYQDEQLLYERHGPEIGYYQRIAQVPATLVDDLEPLIARRGTVKAVCVVQNRIEADRCEALARALVEGRALVTRSQPEFIEITDPLGTKGTALERLCAHLGVEMGHTAAVGDAPNDIDMLERAAFSVVVRTDDRQMLGVADAVCGGPGEAGVADVIDVLLSSAPSTHSVT